MHAALALAFGPLIARLLFDEQLSALVTFLVNAMGPEPWDRSGIHLVRLGVRFGLPTLVAFGLIRYSPMGRWIAFTRLSLGLLLLADGVLLLALSDQLLTYVWSGLHLSRLVGDGMAFVCGVALAVAAVTMLISTLWYRIDGSRSRLTFVGRWLAREA